MPSNIAAVHMQDQVLTSGPAGELVSYHVEQKWWSLGLHLQSVNVGLQIIQLSASGRVTVAWEYSWDGANWKEAGAPVIPTQDSTGLKTGFVSDGAEIAPQTRLRVDVVDENALAQVNATVSLSAHYVLKA